MADMQVHGPGFEERTPLGVLRKVFEFDSFRGQPYTVVEHVLVGGDTIVPIPTHGAAPVIATLQSGIESVVKLRCTCSKSAEKSLV